jgi:transcriptional regulator with XRE-family HTH domain
MDAFRVRVAVLYHALGISRAELLVVLGRKHDPALYKILHGISYTVKSDVLVAVARCFGVSTDFLLGLTDEAPREVARQIEAWLAACPQPDQVRVALPKGQAGRPRHHRIHVAGLSRVRLVG